MSYKQLTQEQRYHLYEMKQMNLPQKQMAKIINVSESTV
ncbi:MAG: IS30 family transposase, partial [Cocleimonas sp.]